MGDVEFESAQCLTIKPYIPLTVSGVTYSEGQVPWCFANATLTVDVSVAQPVSRAELSDENGIRKSTVVLKKRCW